MSSSSEFGGCRVSHRLRRESSGWVGRRGWPLSEYINPPDSFCPLPHSCQISVEILSTFQCNIELALPKCEAIDHLLCETSNLSAVSWGWQASIAILKHIGSGLKAVKVPPTNEQSLLPCKYISYYVPSIKFHHVKKVNRYLYFWMITPRVHISSSKWSSFYFRV